MNIDRSEKLIPNVKLNKVSPVPLHYQLSSAIEASLRDHKVSANTVLTSEASLAKKLNLNRNTVNKAYRRLIEEKVLRRNAGERKIAVTPEFEATYRKESFPVIGLVLPDKLNTLVNQNALSVLNYITGVIDTACSFGFATTVLLLPDINTSDDELHKWFDGVRDKLSALVYIGDRQGESHDKAFKMMLSEERIPQVFIGAESKFKHLANVTVDVKSAMIAALQHLIGLQHQNIGLIFSRIAKRNYLQLQSYWRYDDAVAAMSELSLAVKQEWTVRGFDDLESLEAQITEIMKQPDRPTAFLCHNDRIAKLAVEIIQSLGFKVPGDVSIIGYDDNQCASSCEPALTTIQHPRFLLGKSAVELIYEDYNGDEPIKGRNKVLPGNLIIRGSTGPVNISISNINL